MSTIKRDKERRDSEPGVFLATLSSYWAKEGFEAKPGAVRYLSNLSDAWLCRIRLDLKVHLLICTRQHFAVNLLRVARHPREGVVLPRGKQGVAPEA